MRFIAPVAFLGTAGLGAAWRPSTPPNPLVKSNQEVSSDRQATVANPASNAAPQIDSATMLTRRNWIQCTVLPSSTMIIMSSAAKAALATDNSVDPDSSAMVSPFRQWLNSKLTMSDKNGSSQGDASETSNGDDGSSSSVGGSSSSADDGEASSSDER